MPKVVESKIIFRGEDAISPKLEHIIDVLDRLGSAVDKVAESFNRLSEAQIGGKGAEGKQGVGHTKGSQRSEHAPPQDEEKKRKGFFDRLKMYPGWHSGFRFAGAMMGAGGGIVSGMTHQLTPAVGGMLSAAGGAMMGNVITALPGAAMMAAGGLMTAATIASQPAMSHYSQFSDAYRAMGINQAKTIRQEAMGAFTPDEAMRYGMQLHRVGATAGFGRMAAMRYGEASPEQLAGFMTTATTTGAAGRRGKSDYDYLAKVITGSFGKDKNLISMEQSLNTMNSLMGMSADYLGDVSKDQAKQLAIMTAGMEGSGVAALRGQRGVQTIAGMAGRIAAEGAPGEEMYKWSVFQKYNPGGGYKEYLNWKADITQAPGQVLKSLDPRSDEDLYTAMNLLGIQSPQKAKTIIEGWQQGGTARTAAEKSIKEGTGEIDTRATGEKWDIFTKAMAGNTAAQLKMSENIMPKYLEMETGLIKIMSETLGKEGVFDKAVKLFADQINKLASNIEEKGAGGAAKEIAKGILPGIGNALTLGSAGGVGEELAATRVGDAIGKAIYMIFTLGGRPG